MAKTKILIVEDEDDILFLVKENFKTEGFDVFGAGTAEQGIALARKRRPDVIVSDIMLPKMDGLEMVRILRREMTVPVLFLTAKKDEIDRVAGLELGADDYISKPFSMRELVARVRAVMRRSAPRTTSGLRPPVRIGGIEVDFGRHEVRVNGKYRKLSPREFQLLELLIEADGKVLSREQLLKRIWGYDQSMDINTRTVDQHIARLRRNLLSERKRIATIKNFGYTIRLDR